MDPYASKATSEIKVGYLIKFSKASGTSGQRKRYFVLNGNTLTYHASHRNVENPKGNVLLVGGSVLTDEKVPSVNFAFKLTTPFESIVLAATTAEDRAAWKFAISNAIEFAQYSLRGYMIKKGSYLEGSPRKFFVLHNSILSMHQDHEHTAVSQWAIEITEETEIIAKDDKLQIKVSEGFETVKMVFDKKSANEYIKWKEALFEHITRFTKMKEKEMAEVDAVLDRAVINGNLQIRPPEGGDVWPEYQVALTETSLVLIQSIDNGEHFKVTDTFIITKDCKVLETHLKQFAFQVVTAERILHCAAQTKAIADYWMASILSKIKVSVADDPNDHLFKLAMTRISNDKYYDVTFNEAKPLGIVLEKVGEWALVKISNFKETGVKVGSALCAVNGESVLYEKYEDTVAKLRNWTPPLTLQFRQAPEKKGYLLKKSNKKGKDASWNRRWFVLGEGKLGFYNSDSSFARLVMEMSLFGATIAQVNRETYGKFYAFRVLSGVHSFTVDAADITELREWTSIIYHAIAFANGGSYIVEYELEKQKQEAEMARALAEEQELIAADEYRSQLLENVRLAVEARVLDWLEEAIKAAEDNDVTGEYIDFAKKVLEELREEARQAEEDAKLNAAAAAYEAEQERLAREAAALEAQLGPDGGVDDDDVDDTRANQMKGGAMARNGSLAHRKTRNAVALKPAAMAAQQVATIAEDDEDEEDEDEEEGMDDGTENSAAKLRKRGVVTEEDISVTYSSPANIEQLRKMFRFYVKKTTEEGVGFINVMQFSTIYRIVTKEKGNLYKEMQIFNKFDVEKQGIMVEQDFISGWLNLAIEMQSDEYLRRIAYLLGDNNMLL